MSSLHRRFIRQVMALSAVPISQVDEVWLEIESDSPSTDHESYDLLDWFKRYFINTWLENPTVYPRTLWNHSRCVSEEMGEESMSIQLR